MRSAVILDFPPKNPIGARERERGRVARISEIRDGKSGGKRSRRVVIRSGSVADAA